MEQTIHQKDRLSQLQNQYTVRPKAEMVGTRIRVWFVVEKLGVEFARERTREAATDTARLLARFGQAALTKRLAHKAVTEFRERRAAR